MAVGGESTPRVSYVMTELEDMDGVFAPIKTASRVKYTCFDVSRHYIAFGTTAGGVIILQHDSLVYLKTLAVKEGPVCEAAFAPDESLIGFSTTRGVTIVMEHNADRGTTPPQRLQLSYEHKGSVVTRLQWNVSSSKLFIGDDRGKVSVISVTTSRTRNIFQVPTATLVKLDSKVVQLDYAQDHLLVSTLTRCYLCNTNREQFLQIGKKMRDGEYGACFYPGYRSNDPCTIYSARPGSRMWEVDIKGEVRCTHQFKTALAILPEKVLSFRNEVSMENETMDTKPQATSFNKMLLVWPSSEDLPFIFTWSSHAVYVFDPKRAEVVLWSEDLKGIKDVKCQRGDVYIYFQDGKFAKYSLLTVEHAVCRLYQHGLAVHSAQLLLLKQASLCAARLNIHVPPSFLLDMLQKVSDLGKTYLFTSLSAVFGRLGLSPDKLSQSSRSSSAMSEPMKLGSGMYVVNRIARDLEDTTSVCLSRWRSASPVFRHTSGSPHSSPSRQSGLSSPRRKRSGTLPSVKLRETRDKVGSVTADHTPDSIDSGTSGKASDMSDETHSSPSSKDMIGSFQSYRISDNAASPVEFSEAPVSKQGSISDFRQSENVINGSVINPTFQKGTEKLIASESTKKISLNLSDISKDSSSTGKKVSFDPRTGDKTSFKFYPGNNNGNSSISDSNNIPHLTNGFDSSKKDIALELGEEALYDMCPDSLYEETYSYMNMSLYGMMVPNVDWSMLFGADRDFMAIKESLANKLTTGKNLLKRGLEHLKQSQSFKSDLLDVKSKLSDSDTMVAPKIIESECNTSEKQERNIWSFLPPFDSSELLEITRATRSKLRDPSIMFSEEKLTALLEDWVNVLHNSQKAVIALINSYCQSSYSAGSHSREDDTIKSTCSQVTSTGSSPSENGEPSLRLETEEASISESKSYDDDRHLESMSSLTTEMSESSTLKTESLYKLLSVDDFVFVHDPFRLQKDDHQLVSELVMLCFQAKVWGNVRYLKDVLITLQKGKTESVDRITQEEKDLKDSAYESRDSETLMNGVAESCQDKLSFYPASEFSSFPRTSTPKQFTSSDPNVPTPLQSSQYDICNSANSIDNLSAMSSQSSSNFDNIAKQSAENDSVLFIQNYFHFLDLHRLRELLIVKNEPCMPTWNVMLKGAALYSSKDEFTQKISSGQLDAASNCLERNYSGPVLVSHLLRLFRAKPSRTIELCLHRSYHVTPLDVLYLSKSCNMPMEFMNYVSSVMESLPELQRPKVLNKLLHLDEVRWEWINAVLQDGSCSLLKCKCGFPRPGSHLHPWKYSSLLFYIVTTATTMHEKLFNLCFSSGYWKGYLWLSKKFHFCDNVRQAVVQLGDESLLTGDDDNDMGYLPVSVDEWKQLFFLVRKQDMTFESISCISCGEKHNRKTSFSLSTNSSVLWETTLCWESVAQKALSHLGPLQLLSLFQDIEIPSGALSSRFYSAIILSFLMNKQQSALSHRMQTNIGSYLWSRRPISYLPEIHRIFEKEKQEVEKDAPSEETKGEEDIAIGTAKCYLEEPESHWGRKLSLKGPCNLCKMPLMSHLSLSTSGITVCACGHIYHTACLPEGVCIACIKAQK